MSTIHRSTPRRRGAPPVGERLTHDLVVSRATALIEERGRHAFSLRALAADLDVRPSALYNHVRNLDELLTAVVTAAVAQFELSDSPGTWQQWLQTIGREMRSWLLERPEIAGLILERAGSTPAGPHLLTRVTDRLGASGVDRTVAHLAWHVVYTVVVGTVQQDLARRVSDDGTFEAVLAIAVEGLATTTAASPTPAMRKLVRAHGFSDR
jgi:AcrR family transcriptional regulator